MTASLTASDTAPAPDRENPYIGPRPFSDNPRERRLFFGRDREGADLLSLVLAERLVLFYAPSGAGKSSLINARLLPALRDEGFAVLGTVRVGGQLPAGLALEALSNVYIFNLLRDLDDERSDRNRLTTQRLPDYLAALPADPAHPDRILILDQFEELFTTYADQWEKREDFFRQLSQALTDDPHLWVMLTLREDYIAELDAYTRLLPNRGRVRYRLTYMDAAAALEAVQQPAALAGRPFAPGVAANLVNNLRQMTTGDEAGAAPKLGETVEPVQLQVVCMQLWENLRDRPGVTITAADVESLARGAGLGEFVNHALASFYEQTLAAVTATLAGSGVSEREIRDWFSHTLITRDGTRNLLYQSESETGELPNVVVIELERRFLLRGETRGSGRWVELVHDRLIAPIRDANAQWRRRHPLVIAADLWHADRRAALLLSGQALVDAQTELARHPELYSDVERHFIAASAEAEAAQREQQQREEAKRRQKAVRDRIVALGAAAAAIVMFLLLVLAVMFALQALRSSWEAQSATRTANLERDRANTERDRAIREEQRANAAAQQAKELLAEADQLNRQIRADQLASQAVLALEQSPQQALLLVVEAMRMGVSNDAQLSHAVAQSSHDVLHATGGAPATTIAGDAVALVLGADGAWFAAASADGAVQSWRIGGDALQMFDLMPAGGEITWALATAADGRLAAADNAGVVRVWRMDAPDAAPQLLRTAGAPLYAVAFSADGRWLAAAGEGGDLYLWDTSTPDVAPQTLTGHIGAVNTLTFSPDSQWLASGGSDGSVRLWATGALVQEVAVAAYMAPITGIVFSPDGAAYAAGDQLGGVYVHATPGPDLAKPADVLALSGHAASIRALDYSSNSVWLATGDENGVVRVWNLKDGTRSYVVRAHNSSVRGLAFVRGAGGEKLVTVGDDGPEQASVRLWDYTDVGATPMTVRGHDGVINQLATVRGLNGFLTAGYDHFIRIWLVDDPQAEPSNLVADTPFVDELQTPDGLTLYAIGGATPGIQTWTARGAEAGALLTTTGTSNLNALAVSPAGDLVATGDAGGAIYVWKPGVVTPVAIMTGHIGRVAAVALHPAGRLLVSAGDDGAVRVWNLDTATLLRSLREGGPRITAMSLNAVGDRLVVADSDGVLTYWSMTELDAAPAQWRVGDVEVTSLAFSPDTARLAAGDRSGQLWVWTLATPDTPPQHWQGHTNEVSMVTFGATPDEMFSASADRSVRVWNLAAPLMIPTVLNGHAAAVNSVDFAEGALFTASTDGTLRAWLLTPLELAARACQVAGRNLYQDEWERYLPDTPCQATCPGLPDYCEMEAP